MFIKPEGTIKLYDLATKVYDGRSPIFTSKSAQTAYFNRHVFKTVDNCKYIRHNGYVRINISGADCMKVGYMSFTNKNYENKTFYAFLGEPKYINDQCFEYPWTLDFIQTWMFDVQFADDFIVDREHLSKVDKQKVESNPWRNDVPELLTPEPLPVDENSFKMNYQIGGYHNDITGDGAKLTSDEQFTGENTIDPKFITILYLSELDYTNIRETDVGTDVLTPKDQFGRILNECVQGSTYGFYHEPGANDWIVGGKINSDTHRAKTFTHFNDKLWVIGFDAVNTDTSATELIDKLTQWGCTSAIVGLYLVPTGLIRNNTFRKNDSVQYQIELLSTPTQNVEGLSKKLLRMPYCFTSINSPLGDSKELYFERCTHISEGNSNSIEVAVILDMTGHPSIRVFPMDYVNTFSTGDLSPDITNEFTFEKIPLAPYNIDAYIAQYSAICQNLITQNTTMNRLQMEINQTNSLWGSVASALGSAPSIPQSELSASYDTTEHNFNIERAGKNVLVTLPDAGDFASGVAGVATTVARAATNILSDIDTGKQKDRVASLNYDLITSASTRYLAGDNGVTTLSAFNGTLPPAVVNQYVGSKDTYRIYSDLSFFALYYKNYQLRPEVRDAYDKWFKRFGYKSIRVGVPYFAGYITGGSAYNQPSWERVDDVLITYFKCVAGHIHNVPKYVCDAWESMLQYGMTFIKGDDLT